MNYREYAVALRLAGWPAGRLAGWLAGLCVNECVRKPLEGQRPC